MRLGSVYSAFSRIILFSVLILPQSVFAQGTEVTECVHSRGGALVPANPPQDRPHDPLPGQHIPESPLCGCYLSSQLCRRADCEVRQPAQVKISYCPSAMVNGECKLDTKLMNPWPDCRLNGAKTGCEKEADVPAAGSERHAVSCRKCFVKLVAPGADGAQTTIKSYRCETDKHEAREYKEADYVVKGQCRFTPAQGGFELKDNCEFGEVGCTGECSRTPTRFDPAQDKCVPTGPATESTSCGFLPEMEA